MSVHPAFELVREQQIAEVSSLARFYRHKKTGAEVLSFINDDENKVFGVTFKTPPEDSTGVAHILEHSVLCGSRSYPVKKPFVELLKGSLQTFLNAMTFSDKTAYPVASQNLQDFHNLVDVYLDAVFFPLISEDTFQQEGWHYERDASQAPMVYKGVVFNEMKGAYSSGASVLGKVSQLSLYPDTTYGVNSGGDPKAIPDLTYEYFKRFHERFYHPSNARIVFYGDDPEDARFGLLDKYLGQFDRIEPEAHIALQKRWSEPKRIHETYAATEQEAEGKSAMVSINWMLDPVTDPNLALNLSILEAVLVGTSAAPLRKALIDSGLGEGITGSGLAEDMLQPYFTVGLKGIGDGDAQAVEDLVLATLTRLADEGIDRETIEASVNSMEFALREDNTGSFPRGIALMFRSMRTWLHGGDPLEPLRFEGPLAALKADLAAGKRVFEDLVRTHLLDNTHRTTVLLTPDPTQAAREKAEERARLDAAAAEMTDAERRDVVVDTERLRGLQEIPDTPEALSKIPTLQLSDLPRKNKPLPIERGEVAGIRTFTHALPTNGVIYLDFGFNMHGLSSRLLPLMPIFSRALTQTGTAKEDFVSLTQRIGRSTGGVGMNVIVTTKQARSGIAAWLFMRGKAVPDKTGELFAIMHDVLTSARLDNRERIRQMVLEAKSGFESRLAGTGNGIVALRLRAQSNESDWANEQMGGISHYFYLKELAKRIDADWPGVQADLEAIRSELLHRGGMIANVTADADTIEALKPQLAAFLSGLPESGAPGSGWGFAPAPLNEGLTFPGQVNYVAKGGNLIDLGYTLTGGAAVAIRHLNTTYLWDRVRVQGGAYGGSSGFDSNSGNFVFTSYRDPNLLGTITNYDGAAAYLRAGVGEQDLTRSIIGVIGGIDGYRLPDAKGFSSMMFELTGETEETRQQRREEVLGATDADFETLARALDDVARHGKVVVLGSEPAIKAANEERSGFLTVTRVI
ncbi:MAG TPA: insulinase family protein [Devosia sp.]|nr:insulinase family protein [Devosia sp.]